ncbi:transcriptional regulator [Paenibacillus lemnae]|uniref:Transcriptional regulator n=1 Tax=Paenibacillus lemnae TaxID=1330551 RepID=A0A848MAE2_PAELE|nr:GyrI-like domain-containing protein [Paenibacillus lemnae]NMO98037.1 transcriptional regulator [Paenibacillus lemnae]
MADYAIVEKEGFWESVKQDGRLDSLKAAAENEYIFAVNEAVNNKMMHYAGVITEETLPDVSRLIQFPEGDYLVVEEEGRNTEELEQQLTGIAFGQVLPELNDTAYVGGPNAAVVMGEKNGMVYGEMWIPVIKK